MKFWKRGRKLPHDVRMFHEIDVQHIGVTATYVVTRITTNSDGTVRIDAVLRDQYYKRLFT